MNALDDFSDNIFLLITGKPKPAKELLVKKHSEKLHSQGDFSFPNSPKSWHPFVEIRSNSGDETILQCINKTTTDIINESQKWKIPVCKATVENARVHIFLERPRAIYVGLLQALHYHVVLLETLKKEINSAKIDPVCEQSSITYLRLKYFAKAANNLLAVTSQSVDQISDLMITSKSHRLGEDHLLLCGTVLNAKTGLKESAVNANEFLRLRQTEMTLIAQHKYGVRVTTDSKWKQYLSHIGESAVIFELLQTKFTSAVKVNFDCSSGGSSKGAAFILYNCARLETILRTYNENVAKGTYPPLPAFEDADFTLLTQEDEWCLIFNFIMGLPSLLNNCVAVNKENIEIKPHLICGFLCSMVKLVSQYYRRVRILMEPRKHLLPVIYARIHMLIILKDTLKTCLKILNIKSVSQM